MQKEIIEQLFKKPKGILAIDESIETCNKRFKSYGIPETEEMRREYRELILTTEGIEEYISGMILFDETIHQATKDGVPFATLMKEKGILIGIKVDGGLIDFGDSNEKVTKGLDGLSERLSKYKLLGATFTKWRSVYTINSNTPTEALMHETAKTFAEYARIVLEAGMVPIIEPEVLMDGTHTIEQCLDATSKNLDILFQTLTEQNIPIDQIILKTNMVIGGHDNHTRESVKDVAMFTLKCLREHVPENIGGIVFLSGGQDDTQSTLHLEVIEEMGPLPWPLSFSYGRAIQHDALAHWASNQNDILGAQNLLLERAKANSLASVGKYEG